MIITHDDALRNLDAYALNRKFEKEVDIEVEGDLNSPSAIEAVRILSIRDIDVVTKTNFVYRLLLNKQVTIRFKGETLACFNINDNMSLEAIECFKKYPALFSYFLEAIYGVFLKNCYPQLNESDATENKKEELIENPAALVH